MRKKSIVLGIVLILLALYMIVSRLGYAPVMPFFSAAFTVVFAYTAIRGFVRLNFMAGFLSLAILGCIHDELLHIEQLTPWTLLLSGLLLGAAFEMIFKGVRLKRRRSDDKASIEWDLEWNSDGKDDLTEDCDDGQKIQISNTFGSRSKYVNSEYLKEVVIENNFGECNVYFNNAILAGSRARVRAENNFGSTNLFLPATWRISVHEDVTFGSVNVRGRGSAEEGAPVVELMLESNFGEVNVYFE